MSGDVQPRKRKDKRRKKGQLEAKRSEEYIEESAVFRRQSSTASDEEDLHHAGSTGPEEIIHIQKELGLGGNICAKIVFFCLLGALGVMVGLIITEYRGSSEVETQPASDSPWSLWLDGWIDDSPSHHEAEVVTGEVEDEDEHGKVTAGSSDEIKEEVAKISEILKRTSNKIKKIDPLEDEENEEIGKVEEEKDIEVKIEESPIYEKVEEAEESPIDEEEVEETEEETTGVALKFGVGVALVVVAHVVLVQKWNAVGKGTLEQQEPNETEEEEILPEIVRRQTLIPPSEELPVSQDQNYEYSEGEEEDEEEEDEDEEELVQKTYEDLRAKYEQQTPEGSDAEPTEEDFATKAPDTYDYSPTPPESEPEEEPTESDVEEEEEQDEEDADPMAEWKKRGAALLAEEVEDVQTGSESEDEPPPPVAPLRRGGPLGIGEEDYMNADITNSADWEIKEDLDFADADFNDEDLTN